MITADRFIAESCDRDVWLEARRHGVTATEVRDAATPAGFAKAIEARANPTPLIPNAYMDFGTNNERWLALWAKQHFGLMPSSWLIAGDNPAHLATPDLLSLDHLTIGEIKTGGAEITKPSLAHRRQMNWQMWCTGATRSLYVYMLRVEVKGVYMPAWMEPQTWWEPRDDSLIADLIQVANRLLETDHS
jgi:hypothetical protein